MLVNIFAIYKYLDIYKESNSVSSFALPISKKEAVCVKWLYVHFRFLQNGVEVFGSQAASACGLSDAPIVGFISDIGNN
jgi:hypothetical protein